MGILSRIKDHLPASKRSVREANTSLVDLKGSIDVLHDEVRRLHDRVEQADRGINGNIDFKYDELISPWQRDFERETLALLEHVKLLGWEAVRREGESDHEMRRRFFRSLPKATGSLRLLQLANAELLRSFDRICKENGLRYWAAGGTMIGAVRHGGFIPWDDDVDLCMMRDDFGSLATLVEGDSDHKISIVYDRFALCRQVRFMFADENLPCFLDIFLFDYARDSKGERYDALLASREQLKDRLRESELAWDKDPYLSSDTEGAAAVGQLFDHALAELGEQGVICDKGSACAAMRSLDNFDDPQGHRWICGLDDLFPVVEVSFEGARVALPHSYERFLREAYGDYWSLPKDIRSHYEHVPESVLLETTTLEALDSVVASAKDETQSLQGD